MKWDWNLFGGRGKNGFGLMSIPDSVSGDVYGEEPNFVPQSVQDDGYEPQGFLLQTVHEQTVDVSFTVRGHWQQVLQDYIVKAGPNKNPTGTVKAPGCDPLEREPETGKLIIKKYQDWDGDGRKDANDNLLGGATFRVKGPNEYDVTVKDDEHPDKDGRDGIIELRDLVPGLYTVEEIEAPQGWMIDGNAVRQVQVSGGDPAVVTFHNPKAPDPGKLIIKKYKDVNGDGHQDGKLGGATSRVTGPNNYDVTVQDNQRPDADNDQGEIELRGLLPGYYTISEVAAPPGYIAVGDEQTVEIKSNQSKTVEFLNEKEGLRASLSP